MTRAREPERATDVPTVSDAGPLDARADDVPCPRIQTWTCQHGHRLAIHEREHDSALVEVAARSVAHGCHVCGADVTHEIIPA